MHIFSVSYFQMLHIEYEVQRKKKECNDNLLIMVFVKRCWERLQSITINFKC